MTINIIRPMIPPDRIPNGCYNGQAEKTPIMSRIKLIKRISILSIFMLAAAPEEEDHEKDREWDTKQPKENVTRGGRFFDLFS